MGVRHMLCRRKYIFSHEGHENLFFYTVKENKVTVKCNKVKKSAFAAGGTFQTILGWAGDFFKISLLVMRSREVLRSGRLSRGCFNTRLFALS